MGWIDQVPLAGNLYIGGFVILLLNWSSIVFVLPHTPSIIALFSRLSF